MEERKVKYLDCHKNGMRLAGDAYDHRTLLNCLRRILDLEYSALGGAEREGG